MIKQSAPRPIELLAPARDAATAIAAIEHGADAVYIGAATHGARASAGNSLEDISAVVEFAHKFNVRVYVTVNTLVYDNEISGVAGLIENLYRIGVDALIVQDMGILEMDIPPIALHASTQCDTRDAFKAEFLERVGFSQIVLARELSLHEIADIASKVTVPLEAFVHGALCVSFSGDCRASLLAAGRSANRGECAQMCRLPYDLTDADGNVLVAGKHLLSLKDMNRIDYLERMLDAGVSSFKIEGRLKDTAYVKNVTAAYRKALDRIIDANPGHYRRSSDGVVEFGFEPSLERSFNRGFTPYFISERQPVSIASIDSPKSIGLPVGRVAEVTKNYIILDTREIMSNGDGLGYFDRENRFAGFRANRVEGRKIFLREPVDVSRGTLIYRNRDRRRDIEMEGRTAVRFIPVDMTLRRAANGLMVLEITINNGKAVTVSSEITVSEARTPQKASRKRVLEKLGDTVFRLDNLDDRLSDADFIPASQLTALRRDAIAAVEFALKSAYRCDYRRRETDSVAYKTVLTSRDNVANRLAENFYRRHGVSQINRALEVAGTVKNGEIQVMECRYCIRRELGACLKHGGASKLPSQLYLRSANVRFRLDFDCRNCMMKVISVKNDSV